MDPRFSRRPTGYLGPVSEPDAPSPAEITDWLDAAQKDREAMALLQEIRKRERRLSPAVMELAAEFWDGVLKPGATLQETLQELVDSVVCIRGDAAVLNGEGTLTAEAQVIKPTRLPEWFVRLPYRQRAAIIVIGLVVLTSVELPEDVQNRLAYLIAVLTGYIAGVKWITRKR
jgi:hypothetical protein